MQHHKADIFETTRDEVEGYDEFIGSHSALLASIDRRPRPLTTKRVRLSIS